MTYVELAPLMADLPADDTVASRTPEILRDRAAVSAGALFFVDARGETPGERHLERSLRRLGREGVTSHSFRALFLDWLVREGAPKGSAT